MEAEIWERDVSLSYAWCDELVCVVSSKESTYQAWDTELSDHSKGGPPCFSRIRAVPSGPVCRTQLSYVNTWNRMIKTLFLVGRFNIVKSCVGRRYRLYRWVINKMQTICTAEHVPLFYQKHYLMILSSYFRYGSELLWLL